MTKAQRTLLEIQGRQSEMRSRLAVLSAQDSRSADEETELTTVETKLSGCEPELRSALAAAAAEDDSARTVETTDPETRERLELRSKTGLADFLKAAVGRFGGHWRGCRVCGRVRRAGGRSLADGAFCAHSAHGRDAGHYSGASREGHVATDRPVRVRAVGGGEPRDPDAVRAGRPSTNPEDHHSARRPTRWQKTARLRPRLRRSRWSIRLRSESPASFEVRVEDLAVMPSLEAALSEAMQGSLSNELGRIRRSTVQAGELNGLFVQASERKRLRLPSRPIRLASVVSRRWWTGDTPIPSLMCGPSSGARRSRSTRACSPTPTRAT